MDDDAEQPFELEIVTVHKPDGLYVVWSSDGEGGFSRLGPFSSLDASELAVIQVIEGFRKALGRTVVVHRVREDAEPA